jgi:hypothetical protein
MKQLLASKPEMLLPWWLLQQSTSELLPKPQVKLLVTQTKQLTSSTWCKLLQMLLTDHFHSKIGLQPRPILLTQQTAEAMLVKQSTWVAVL